MQILIQHRAEISLRSLPKVKQKQIARALDELKTADLRLLYSSPKLHRLHAPLSEKKLYAYRGSLDLRLLLSFEDDTCTVEDVATHERLDRWTGKQRQE